MGPSDVMGKWLHGQSTSCPVFSVGTSFRQRRPSPSSSVGRTLVLRCKSSRRFRGDFRHYIRDQAWVFWQTQAEVSALDYANAVRVNNQQIPALTSRKAATDLVLRPGESLVIGGLYQANEQTNVEKIPLLGDIPILGELFKSTSFQRQDSELRLIITPRLVTPADSRIEFKEAPSVKPLLTPKQQQK